MSAPWAGEPLVTAIAALERALAVLGADHMIIGGIAVIARGVVRKTDDIDATVWGEQADLDKLMDALRARGIQARTTDAVEFARRHQVLLLRHEPSGTPMEVSLGWLPFEREALNRADKLDLGGVTAPVARAEDLVVYKVVAWRDRDRDDVRRLLGLHGRAMDLGRVRRLVREFAEALEQPERIGEFDRLVAESLEP